MLASFTVLQRVPWPFPTAAPQLWQHTPHTPSAKILHNLLASLSDRLCCLFWAQAGKKGNAPILALDYFGHMVTDALQWGGFCSRRAHRHKCLWLKEMRRAHTRSHSQRTLLYSEQWYSLGSKPGVSWSCVSAMNTTWKRVEKPTGNKSMWKQLKAPSLVFVSMPSVQMARIATAERHFLPEFKEEQRMFLVLSLFFELL